MLYLFLVKGENPAIINVASLAGSFDVQTGSPSGMSKSALIQMRKNLAVEWTKIPIRVNSISPRFTETALTVALLGNTEELGNILDRTPMGRVAKPEEMATVIAFLSMRASSYTTGQNINIGGKLSVNAL